MWWTVPHGGGKIPLMPNYLVSASDDAVVLRNYEGMLVRYQAQDKPTSPPAGPTRGVSSLLAGSSSALIPEGNERMARRTLRVIEESSPAANGCCNGDGASHADGVEPAELLPLIQVGSLNGNGHTNGNGHVGRNGH